ncbi:hypothetical protein C1H76_7794 [Elsinoe australis]|uniref:Uncharacterized protein n=1 Tax=Elsinoe australis TaxID=40998 RepID=A0A4U7AU47_9PEZI|nr:hypothetical protein C1H76_7794 [Elsinoe australis]
MAGNALFWSCALILSTLSPIFASPQSMFLPIQSRKQFGANNNEQCFLQARLCKENTKDDCRMAKDSSSKDHHRVFDENTNQTSFSTILGPTSTEQYYEIPLSTASDGRRINEIAGVITLTYPTILYDLSTGYELEGQILTTDASGSATCWQIPAKTPTSIPWPTPARQYPTGTPDSDDLLGHNYTLASADFFAGAEPTDLYPFELGVKICSTSTWDSPGMLTPASFLTLTRSSRIAATGPALTAPPVETKPPALPVAGPIETTQSTPSTTKIEEPSRPTTIGEPAQAKPPTTTLSHPPADEPPAVATTASASNQPQDAPHNAPDGNDKALPPITTKASSPLNDASAPVEPNGQAVRTAQTQDAVAPGSKQEAVPSETQGQAVTTLPDQQAVATGPGRQVVTTSPPDAAFTFAGHSFTRDDDGALLATKDQPLHLGQTVSVGSPDKPTPVVLTTNAVGSTVLIVGGSTTATVPVAVHSPTSPAVIVGGQTFHVTSSSLLVAADGQVLRPGSTVNIGTGGTSTPMVLTTNAAGSSVVIVGGSSTTTLPALTRSTDKGSILAAAIMQGLGGYLKGSAGDHASSGSKATAGSTASIGNTAGTTTAVLGNGSGGRNATATRPVPFTGDAGTSCTSVYLS